MGARWYQPTTATFTTRDTIPGLPDTPITLNRYTYAGANPTRYWDPNGRFLVEGTGGANEIDTHGVNNATDYHDQQRRNRINRQRQNEYLRQRQIARTAALEKQLAIDAQAMRNTATTATSPGGHSTISQIGGFFLGFAEGAVEAGMGMAVLVYDGGRAIAAGAGVTYQIVTGTQNTNSWSYQAFTDIDHKYSQVWNQLTSRPIHHTLLGVDRIDQEQAAGNTGEAWGHGVFNALTIVIPARAAAKAGLASVTDDVARATNTARPSAFSRTESLSDNAATREVADIAESMRAGGWQGSPIKVVDVDGRLYVVDGHHRLAAARQVGLEVPYEIVDPATVIGPGQWRSLDDILTDAASVGPDRLRR